MRLKKIISIFCLACILTGCGLPEEAEPEVIVVPEKENVKYSTAIVKKADLKSTKSVSCTFQQSEETTVIIPGAGKQVTKICVSNQEKVKKGQLLLMLGGEDLETRIADLQYKIDRNSILLKYTDESDRYKKEDLEDQLYIDGLSMEKLCRELEDSRIYAETDGVVTWIKNGLLGSTSSENERVMTIVDTSGCIFTVQKNKYTDYLSPNENVSMKINIGSAAGVYELKPYNTSEWGAYLYYELLPDYSDVEINVGTTGYITVTLDSKESVLKLPAKAIHEATDKAFVYVLDENEVRTVKWITTGLYGDDGVEVVSGLEEGEMVLLK